MTLKEAADKFVHFSGYTILILIVIVIEIETWINRMDRMLW